LAPTEDNWEWHDDLDLEDLWGNSGDYHREMNILSPLTTLAGENAAYYYDQMQVEKYATPAGLGMVDGDTVVIWDLPNPKRGTKLWKFKKKIIRLALKGDVTSQLNKPEISRKVLSEVLSEALSESDITPTAMPYPLELVQHNEHCMSKDAGSALISPVEVGLTAKMSEVLTVTLEKLALKALKPLPSEGMVHLFLRESDTTGTCSGRKNSCLVGLALAKTKIQTVVTMTICELFNFLLPWLAFCQKEGYHDRGSSTPCKQMEDLLFSPLPDIGKPGTCYRRLVSVSDVSFRLAEEWDTKSTVFVGPVRNSMTQDSSPKVPTFCLLPHTREASVYELVLAWRHYAEEEARKHHPDLPPYKKCHDDLFRRKGLHHLVGPHILQYNQKKVDFKKSVLKARIGGGWEGGFPPQDVLIEDVIDNSASKHYFVISGPTPCDNRDLDQLTEFIEGSPVKKEKAKRKKKSKKSSTPASDSDQKPTVREVSPCLGPSSGVPSGQQVEALEQGEEETTSLMHPITEGPSTYENELGIKEAELKVLLDKDISLVEWTGKKMRMLISAVDRNEDKKHSMQKEVTNLEVQMSDLRDQLLRVEAKREQILRDIEIEEDLLNANLHMKKELEDFVAHEVDENRKAKLILEQDIESLKVKIEKGTKCKEDVSANEIKPEIQKFLDNINNKIEAKERDLECPICMEVCSAPIFCCDEQHIICSSCRPQVSVCPECREPYPEKPRRHRFAERAAEELAALESERADILDSNLKNISVDGNMDISSDPNSEPANEPARISSIPEAAKENLPEVKNSSKTKKQTQTKRKQQKK